MKKAMVGLLVVLAAGSVAACAPGSNVKNAEEVPASGASVSPGSSASGAGNEAPVGAPVAAGDQPQAEGRASDREISQNWEGLGSTGGGTGTGTSIGTTAPPEVSGGQAR